MITFIFSITIGFKNIYTIYYSIAGDEVIYKILNRKYVGMAFLVLVIPVIVGIFSLSNKNRDKGVMAVNETEQIEDNEGKKDFIKYAEFNIPYEVLDKAMKIDIESHDKEIKINWIYVLAYLSAKYGGDFKSHYKAKDMDAVVSEINNSKSIDELTEKMKYFKYYKEVYTAVLGEFIGDYSIQVDTNENGEPIFEDKYGLKAFLPIAKTFPYQHYADFGAARSYGYARPHLGHDMMAAVGTPVIAIESGTVEIMGWNQYGGWRVGIRSFDKKRYYYYAHLRKDKPFHEELCEGKVVKAGDVIGYVGRTGYSPNENVNNIETSHLHVGLELIFDESQKECNNEIWVDLYDIVKLLAKNQSAVKRVAESKQFYRQFDFKELNLTK
jgi:murein DD-endopeptidase MepM/ murein hydrolase activator NlpD